MTLQEFIKNYPFNTSLQTKKRAKLEFEAFCMAVKLFKLNTNPTN